MKKSLIYILVVVLVLIIIGLVAYVLAGKGSQNVSASIYGGGLGSIAGTTSDIVIYKADKYYQATYVKNLLKPNQASQNIYVISGGSIYPTDGKRREKTDTAAPRADQMKIELANGDFYLAYKNFPNSLDEVPEAKRTDVYAYEGKLFYLSNAIRDRQVICSKGGKLYLVGNQGQGYAACELMQYGAGMVIDLQRAAKLIAKEKTEPVED